MMLLSVYPEGVPPPKSGPNWIYIAIAGCGGCAILAIVGVSLLTFFAMKTGQKFVNSIEARTPIIEQFQKHLQAHEYAEAQALMSPEGRRALSVEKLSEMAKAAEAKLGPMQSWKSADTNPGFSPSPSPQGSDYMDEARYRVSYKKGDAEAVFTFRSKDLLQPSAQIADFQLKYGITKKHNDAGIGQPTPDRVEGTSP